VKFGAPNNGLCEAGFDSGDEEDVDPWEPFLVTGTFGAPRPGISAGGELLLGAGCQLPASNSAKALCARSLSVFSAG
jgi:hypothetical protein